MQKRIVWGLWGIVCLLVVTGFWWLAIRGRPVAPGARQNRATGITTPMTTPASSPWPRNPAAGSPPGIGPKPYRPDTGLVKPNPAWRGEREKQRAEVQAALNELRNLYGYVGELPVDKARQLLAQRRAAEEALVQRLAALGPGGARVMQETFRGASEVRTQLLLARALGAIDDPQAATVAGELLASEGSLSLRKTLVASLGQRFDDAGATLVLRTTVAGDSDPQVRYAAAQALSGRPAALETLVQRMQQEVDQQVRLEAIRAVGLIGNAMGHAALLTVAQDISQELIVRQTAIQELRRSYGMHAWTALQRLRENPEPAIRASAESALTILAGNHDEVPGKVPSHP